MKFTRKELLWLAWIVRSKSKRNCHFAGVKCVNDAYRHIQNGSSFGFCVCARVKMKEEDLLSLNHLQFNQFILHCQTNDFSVTQAWEMSQNLWTPFMPKKSYCSHCIPYPYPFHFIPFRTISIRMLYVCFGMYAFVSNFQCKYTKANT